MNSQRLFLRRLWGRMRWPITDGVVIDKRHLKKVEFRTESYFAYVSIDEYLVEIREPDGAARRLRIQENNLDIPGSLKHGADVRGKEVRLHLNAQGTKAVFAKDPRESKAERKQRERERRERDDARFRQQEGC